jgi:hypothetical protein
MRCNLIIMLALLLALPALAKVTPGQQAPTGKNPIQHVDLRTAIVHPPIPQTQIVKPPLFHDGFADMKAWTLQPPIDAVGPIDPNGTWALKKNGIVATGTAKPWTIQTAGDPSWTDVKVSATLTIEKPAPKSDFPIYHGEYDRYLPRDWFPKLCDHTGIYRFRYYAGEFDWGSDAAVYFRYQNRENCYRVQLSSEYQEMILWHSTGGYLAVVPCKVVPGQAYQVNVLAQGAHIQVFLDGVKTIDYWHDCLPTLSGGIGLAAYNSTVAFNHVTVTAMPAPGPMPAHQAVFTHRVWRAQPWIFDGNEPICLLETGKTGFAPDYGDGVMAFFFVKLRPGYRPMYQTFVSVRKNEAKTALLKGDEMKAVTYTGQGTGKLAFAWDGETSDKIMASHHTDVLTYDRARGTYRHDITADLTFNKDERIFALEFSDPLTYNNKTPGRGVKYRWLPAGHAWGVMRSEDGSITRHPISQSLNIDGQNSWYLQPGNGLWILYPDRAVCPVFEHHTPNERTYVGVCHWGFDWHQYVHWGDKPRDIKAGTKFTISHTLTGYTPQESEAYFLASKLHPKNDQPETEPNRPLYGKLPSPLGYAVVDPAGTSFDKLYDTREPYVGWQWYGDYAMDREVGHTDHYAMRLDGPAAVQGMFYHHMIDNYAKRYLCTFWVKTKGVKGSVVAKLYYPWNEKVQKDVIDTGLTGDNDWTEYSFITTVPCMTATNYDASEFSLTVSGTGSVWMDDWSVRPLEANEQVTEKRPAPVTAPAAAAPSADYLIYLPCNEGSGPALADASGHGNHAKLYGVTWVTDNGRPVLRFAGKYPVAYIKSLSAELQPPPKNEYPRAGLTLDAWVKPVAGKGGDIMGYFYSPRLYLTPAAGGKFTVSFNVLYAGKWETVTSGPLVPADAWSHVAGVIDNGKARVYVNGKQAAEKALADGKLTFTHYSPVISIGTYNWLSSPSYQGDMAEIRWWSRAATADELAATAAKGRP